MSTSICEINILPINNTAHNSNALSRMRDGEQGDTVWERTKWGGREGREVHGMKFYLLAINLE